MRKIGLLGGMSWESTAEYYRLLNEGVRDALGGLHSAQIVLASVDFAEVERMQVEGRWEDAGALLAAEARGLEDREDVLQRLEVWLREREGGAHDSSCTFCIAKAARFK